MVLRGNCQFLLLGLSRSARNAAGEEAGLSNSTSTFFGSKTVHLRKTSIFAKATTWRVGATRSLGDSASGQEGESQKSESFAEWSRCEANDTDLSL